MDSSKEVRTRLVRDYSTSGMFTSPHPRQTAWQDRRSPSRQQSENGHIHTHLDSVEVEKIRNLGFSLDPVEERENYEASISTQPTATSVTSNSRIADFFGAEVFQIVLHNPTTAHRLREFARSRLCGENLEFLEKVDQYQHLLDQVTKTIFEIHRGYISVNAPSQVNLPDDVLINVNKNLKNLLSKTIPNMESVFVAAQSDTERLVASDVYPRFVRHQMTSSAARALATNKNKYAGLGDCFVLTNPNKADNPIVYASDGFVKVTGYARNEIIPRNCRFLQTHQTDRESVARIKKSVTEPAEAVELLLNERKNGEPFWNLLYTAPLYDSAGKLAFFIGGQINVSTTVHNTSDILRILSFGAGDENADVPLAQPQKSHRQSFFGAFRRQKVLPNRTPGMENELLEDFNNMSFKEQKEAFYTAYSQYIIISADSMQISFYSAGIGDLLYPTRMGNLRSQFVGQDIFTFLSHHSSGSLPRDYKSQVRAAIKSGQAISLDLSLSTKRTMGTEKFLTHWTPLKNDLDEVGYIVLTLGSLQNAR